MYQRHGDLAHEAIFESGKPGFLDRRIPSGWLIAGIASFLGGTTLLLWRFVDFAPWWLYGAGFGLLVTSVALVARATTAAGPSVRCFAICLAVAAVLLLLAGEGRLFYANIDWQARDAVLRDMAIHRWPFAYTARGAPELLRAPIGMYLVPALAAKALGASASDWTLLMQNSLILGTLLALAATLFDDVRAKAIALTVFVGFSGMDAIGQALTGPLTGRRHVDHLEWWSGLQYSSHITDMFWAPQHALAGWIGALCYLLWRAGRLPTGVLLGIVPLTALWSPLGMIGVLPFVAVDLLLRRRALAIGDVALPLLTGMLSVPALMYLTAASGSVGLRFSAITPLRYALFELIEVVPLVVAGIALGWRARFGGSAMLTTAACLALLPFWRMGESFDFMMRVSIAPLAVLAAQLADVLAARRGEGWARAAVIVCLAIGSVTPLHEIKRAFLFPASPQVRCSFFTAWDQSFARYGKSTYLAPLSEVPAAIRPGRVELVPAEKPARCWDGVWMKPSGV